MKRGKMIVGMLAILLAAAVVVQAAEPGVAEEGFVPLFDSKTLEGWITTGNWIVEEAAWSPCIRGRGNGWTRYDAYLTTARKYKDFVLDLEFKIGKGGNSGVFLRVGNRRTRSVAASRSRSWILTARPTRRTRLWRRDRYGGAPKNMAKPAGEWNRYVITCQGKRLKVELNGEQIIDLELDKSAIKDRPAEGYIGFQDEGKPVWYRNVRIKELK